MSSSGLPSSLAMSSSGLPSSLGMTYLSPSGSGLDGRMLGVAGAGGGGSMGGNTVLLCWLSAIVGAIIYFYGAYGGSLSLLGTYQDLFISIQSPWFEEQGGHVIGSPR